MAKATATQTKLGFSAEEVENNCRVTVEGKVLTVTIALDAKGAPSGSGKSIVLGTTRGNKAIEIEGIEGAKLGVNFYKSVE